jgi:hypothetical protein
MDSLHKAIEELYEEYVKLRAREQTSISLKASIALEQYRAEKLKKANARMPDQIEVFLTKLVFIERNTGEESHPYSYLTDSIFKKDAAVVVKNKHWYGVGKVVDCKFHNMLYSTPALEEAFNKVVCVLDV